MAGYPKKIKYKKGYKYQLVEDYTIFVSIYPGEHIEEDWLTLTIDGYLTIKKGYAWDGASGPTFDTADSMRGSLVHDALYQLMRLGRIPEQQRNNADKLLYCICVEDGMSRDRAKYWENAVRLFAASCAKAGTEKEVIEAP